MNCSPSTKASCCKNATWPATCGSRTKACPALLRPSCCTSPSGAWRFWSMPSIGREESIVRPMPVPFGQGNALPGHHPDPRRRGAARRQRTLALRAGRRPNPAAGGAPRRTAFGQGADRRRLALGAPDAEENADPPRRQGQHRPRRAGRLAEAARADPRRRDRRSGNAGPKRLRVDRNASAATPTTRNCRPWSSPRAPARSTCSAPTPQGPTPS